MDLRDAGLRHGDEVRYRRRDDERWKLARVGSVEADQSLRLVDRDGASLSITVECIEVRRITRRNAKRWVPLTERIGEPEQLGLF